MKRICRTAALLLALISISRSVDAHTTGAAQLFGYQTATPPSPMDGNIAPDGLEGKWGDAFVRSVTFASQDGSATRNGTVLIASDDSFLYIAVGFNSQSASNNNYATIYFDENHNHVLDGSSSTPGEYYIKLLGTGPSIQENGGYYGTNGWGAYAGVFPAGFEGLANKHGTGSPQTWNFEFKVPLRGGTGPAGENFLNLDLDSQIGLLIEVFDSSDGVMYWQPTSRDPMDPSTWGAINLGVRGPERDVASSISLGHDPMVDGVVSSDPEWQHYTSFRRQVVLLNNAGEAITGRIYSKSNATDLYVGLVLDGIPAVPGDALHVYFDYDTASNDDLDHILDPGSENGASVTYSGVGAGSYDDTHFDATASWLADNTIDGEGGVTHTGSSYEFEFRVPMVGTGSQDLELALGALVGMNLEFADVTSGESFWWDLATNSRQQKLRIDAASFTGLGWSRVQTGAPVLQPVLPREGDKVSGHFPFIIYAASAAGETGIVSAEFSDDLGLSWQALARTDDSGEWTRTWDTTGLTDGAAEVRIRATDSDGLIANVVIHVTIDNTGVMPSDLPVVTIFEPDPGAYVHGIASLEWTAVPAAGQTISSTQVSIDGDAWMNATSPFSLSTTTLQDGSHIFRVRAIQSDNLVSSSETRLVLVDNTAPELEDFQVSYPEGQTAAKAGDVVLVTALVRDAGAGLDPSTVVLDATKADGAMHVMVDDGTSGDAVAGDHTYSYAITVTSTVTATDSIQVAAVDVLGNGTPSLVGLIELDNTAPSHVSTLSGDADVVYKNTDVIQIVTSWDGAGHALTADFSAVDANYVTGAEQVTDNGDGSYTIVYAISFENTLADSKGLAIPITAFDRTGNGPTTHASFVVELDNTVPAFNSIDTAQDNYRDGETVVVTVTMDDSTYRLTADFSNIDSNFRAGDEVVQSTGNTYTITYSIAADSQNTTPDGSYDIEIRAEDLAGNVSYSSTSLELDNTVESVTIYRPADGTILTGDVVIEVGATDDTRFVRFQVSDDGGSSWYNLQGTQTPFDYSQDNDASDGWTQVWHTNDDALADGTNYVIRVLAYDEQNPVAHFIGEDMTDGGLTVDNTSPSISIRIAPLPSESPLTGEVYEEEVLLTGEYHDLPDSSRVVSVTIEHRNSDGDHVNSSPIHVPATTDRAFSRLLRLVEGVNHLTVTATDHVDLSAVAIADLTYVIPENAATIGPAGGTVTSPDGTYVIVPPGALQEAIRISITQIPDDELPPTEGSNISLLKRAHRFEPEGTVFYKPVDIVMTYTDADIDRDQNGVADWDEMQLSVFFVENQAWIATDRPVRDPINNTLRLRTNHFSTYDIGVVTAPATEGRLYWTKNPLMPREGTTCVFEMPEDGTLTLRIYDLSGQLIRTIASGEHITSESSVRWDGQNDFNSYVGSGVYIYVAQFVGESGTRMTVRKPIGVVK